MKYVGCILALIVIGFYPVAAQTLLKPTPKPSFKGLSTEKGLSFYSNPEYKFSERSFKVQRPEERQALVPSHRVENLRHDNMPNLQPMGIFPSINVMPDETTKYSLIITDPSKDGIPKGLNEKHRE
ncbi:MAG: hypothetical protein RIC06_06160 [Cyclobacteriaceae bacterium]